MDAPGITAVPASFCKEVLVDPEAEYDELFVALWPRLYRMAFAVARDEGAAEDAVQAAFAKAYASWDRVRRADQPEAYLRRMVINEVLGARRAGWFRRERPHEHVGASLASDAPDGPVTDRTVLWAAVCALPVRQRAVIVLR